MTGPVAVPGPAPDQAGAGWRVGSAAGAARVGRQVRSEAAAAARRPVGVLSALLAVVLAVGWLHQYRVRADQLAARYVRALGPRSLDFKAQTLTLQRAALRRSDVLPIYGTSELYCCGAPYNAGTFFANAPTGFAVFNVGYPVTEDLFFAETFGALGHELRGKKVVVSDSPWFSSPTGIGAQAYAHTFSPEIAEVFAFDAPLPLPLHAAVARRMLAFPDTLHGMPLLRAGLESLAHGGWWGYGGYLLLQPAGRLAAWIQELHDAAATIAQIDKLAHPKPPAPKLNAVLSPNAKGWARTAPWLSLWSWLGLRPAAPAPQPLWQLLVQAQERAAAPAPLNPNVPDRPRQIDWVAELQKADQLAARQSASNPFGIADGQWQKCNDISPGDGWCRAALQMWRQKLNNHDGSIISVPPAWVDGVERCTCWMDLDLEFRVLDAVGARPLAWVQPLQGYYLDFTPYSAPARRILYDRYLAIARADGVPATTFQTHDTDPLFIDSFGHLSQRGWLYADRLLDLFWHDQLALVRADLARGGSVDSLFPPTLNCPRPAYCRGVDDVPPLPGELRGLPVSTAGAGARPGGRR